MKKLKKFYLAHSVELINSVRRFELNVQGNYNVDLVNPFINNTFENLSELKGLRSRNKVIEYMNTRLTPELNRKIVKYDLEVLRKCDYILAIFNEVSFGTTQEIFAAWYLYNMPVYVINVKYRNHPWLREIVRLSEGKIFSSRKEFKEWLNNEGFRKEI